MGVILLSSPMKKSPDAVASVALLLRKWIIASVRNSHQMSLRYTNYARLAFHIIGFSLSDVGYNTRDRGAFQRKTKGANSGSPRRRNPLVRIKLKA